MKMLTADIPLHKAVKDVLLCARLLKYFIAENEVSKK